MEELLDEATINMKGLMSAYSYTNTQGKIIPNSPSNDCYEIANVPQGCFACIEINGGATADFLIARIIVNYSSSSGFNCRIFNALNPHPELIGFYTDGVSKIYVNRRKSFNGGIKVMYTTMNFSLTMNRILSTEGLIEIQ